jgi:hypothetical protein
MKNISEMRLAKTVTFAGLFFIVLLSPSAWAYKVERVCEDIAATDKKPARKVCKTLLVRPKPADGKEDKKEEKKEEKKHGGH